jgi:hypothetical protein
MNHSGIVLADEDGGDMMIVSELQEPALGLLAGK